MKLELKHLAPYLPYGLKFLPTQYNKEVNKLTYLSTLYDSDEFGVNGFTSKWIKPILRPLSDLTKEIEHNGERFIPMIRLSKEFDMSMIEHCFIEQNFIPKHIKTFRFEVVHQLLEWHFDIFGLIENGLAIDLNTLNQK